MIERQCRQLIEREPLDRFGVVGGLRFHLSRFHLCQIYHGDRPASRIPARISAGIELLKGRDLNSGFFAQFSPRGIVQALVLIDETSWQCPTSGKWVVLTLD